MRKDHKKENLRMESHRQPNNFAFVKQEERKVEKDLGEGQKKTRKKDDFKGKDIDLMNYTDL